MSEFERLRAERAADTGRVIPLRRIPAQYETIKADQEEHLHCRRCGATWDGAWEETPHLAPDGSCLMQLPKYEGGLLRYTAKNGGSYVFRCDCDAGRQLPTAIQPAPDWFWSLCEAQGTPGRAVHPELLEARS